MAKVLGIDLGTTFSCMATVEDTGGLRVVENSDGDLITASCIEFDGDTIIVGKEAAKSYGNNDNVVGRWKREMGTDKEYDAAGKKWTPRQLSSLVLKKLYEDATQTLGEIDEVVVTVPANFSDEAREDTMEAAKLAGFEIKHIIDEPTAAALYYAQTQGLNSGTYGVFDLGGGTFDISIIEIDGFNVTVKCSNGVSKLGGDDFDKEIMAIVNSKYETASGKPLASGVYGFDEAETDKKTLSKREQVRAASGINDESISITRVEYEEAISKYLAQMKMACEGACSEIDMETSQLDGIILAGGATRTPCVQTLAKDLFECDPIVTANPDTVIGLGAAFYAILKTDKPITAAQRKDVEQTEVTEVVNGFYGTLLVDPGTNELENVVIIPKNTQIPATEVMMAQTMVDNQTKLECKITECRTEEKDPEYVKVLIKDTMNLPGGRPAGQEIEITFTVDTNGTLKGTFLDIASGEKGELTKNIFKKDTNVNDSIIDQFDIE